MTSIAVVLSILQITDIIDVTLFMIPFAVYGVCDSPGSNTTAYSVERSTSPFCLTSTST